MNNPFKNNIDKSRYKLVYSSDKRFNNIVLEIRKTESNFKKLKNELQRIN